MEHIGGHRLVRVLGRGSRSRLWLAESGDGGPLVVKRYLPHVGLRSIDTEIDALVRGACRHVVPLLDVSIDGDGLPALILGRADPRGLTALLEQTQLLAPGETVTVLAPIAEAVAGLHEAGIAHGSLRASKILIDGAGAPILVGFGEARVFGNAVGNAVGEGAIAAAELLAEPSARHDLYDLATLARQLVARTSGDGARCIEEWLDAGVPEGRESLDYARRLADRMFELAEPVALGAATSRRLVAMGGSTAGDPVIDLRSRFVSTDGDVLEPVGSSEGAPVWLAALGLPPWLSDFCAGVMGPLRGVASRVREQGQRARGALASIRPRYRILGIVALLLVVACSVMLFDGGGAHQAETEQAGTEQLGEGSGAAPPLPAGSADEGAADEGSLEGILAALLVTRSACFAELSLLCLDDVDQALSTAWQNDADALRLAQSGVAPPEGTVELGSHIVLVDEFGDTALLTVGRDKTDTSPASVLIMRTEAGWLIRSVVAA